MLSKEQQKENAIKALEKIQCYKPYLNAFKKGTITMYEGVGGYYLDKQEQAVLDKISQIEKELNGTVFAVIHQFTDFGELYTMLWSTAYEEDVEYTVEKFRNGHYGVFAYVWNKTYEPFSEFGTVEIMPYLGGLVRVN